MIINRRLPPALQAVQRERLPQPAMYSKSHICNAVYVAVLYAALAVVTFMLVNPIVPSRPSLVSVPWLKGFFDLAPVVPLGEERAQLLPYSTASESIYSSLGTTMYLTALSFVSIVLAITSMRIADRAVDMLDVDGEDDLPLSILFTKDGILFFALIIQVELFGTSPHKAEKALHGMLLAHRESLSEKEEERKQQEAPMTPKSAPLPTPPVSSAERPRKKSKSSIKKKKPQQQPQFSKPNDAGKEDSKQQHRAGRYSIGSADVGKHQPNISESPEEDILFGDDMNIEDEASTVVVDDVEISEEAPEDQDAIESESSEPEEEYEEDLDVSAESWVASSEVDQDDDEEDDHKLESEGSANEKDHQHMEEQDNQRSFSTIWEFGKHIDLLRGIYPANPKQKTSVDSISSAHSQASAPPGFDEEDRLEEELPFKERTSSRFLGYFSSKNQQQQQEPPAVEVAPLPQSASRRVSMQNEASAAEMEAQPPTAGAAWRWKLNSTNTQPPPTQYAQQNQYAPPPSGSHYAHAQLPAGTVCYAQSPVQQYPPSSSQYPPGAHYRASTTAMPSPAAISIASPHAYPQAYSQDVSTWRNPAYNRRVSSAATVPAPAAPTGNVNAAAQPYYNQAFSSLNMPNRASVARPSSSFFASNASMMSNPDNANPYAPPKRNYSRNSSSSSSTSNTPASTSNIKEKRYYN